MYQTPWTKKTSSVPSDRIRQKPPADAKAKSNLKAKAKGRQEEPTKSKEVRKLESLLTTLRESAEKSRRIEKDPKGGCFCLARTHNLSPYVQLCTSCGFILCVINLPSFACASCASPLLTPSGTSALVARIESELASTLSREAEARERAAEEVQKAAGAFPVLSVAGIIPPTPPPIVAPQAHKVLSLNSKTKKVTISSYSPGSSRPTSRGLSEPEAGDDLVRIPKPLGADVVVYAKRSVGTERPWENLRVEGAIYVPPARVDGGTPEKTEAQGNRRRRGKGKATVPEKENEGTDITTS